MNPDAFWVTYNGPMASVVSDAGTTFPRGEQVEVSPMVWATLRTSPAAPQFTFSPIPAGCCSGANQSAMVQLGNSLGAPPPVLRRVHISLNVGDLQKSLDFYRVLFGVEPSKCHDDYAKFDVPNPPTVFSLVPGRSSSGGALRHMALQVAANVDVDAVKARLDAAQRASAAPTEVVAGFARRYQLTVLDPDGNRWEIHTVHELLDANAPPVAAAPLRADSMLGYGSRPIVAPNEPAPGQIWEHRLSVPSQGPKAESEPLDEVRLTGTMNGSLSTADRRNLIARAVQALRPGGRVEAHGLFADRPLPGGPPKLPGIASVVARVATLAETIDELRQAGLTGVQIVKFGVRPAFVHDGVPLREVRFVGFRPLEDAGQTVEVLYRGPFAEVRDEVGGIFPRGKKVAVSSAVARRLSEGATAEQFAIFQPENVGACGAT